MPRDVLGPDGPHVFELVFEYPAEEWARIVEQSVNQEVGEIDGDRTRATVHRDGNAVVVRGRAEDLVGLRAGTNTWTSLVSVAERSVDVATPSGKP